MTGRMRPPLCAAGPEVFAPVSRMCSEVAPTGIGRLGLDVAIIDSVRTMRGEHAA
jgi:hypothetical protein